MDVLRSDAPPPAAGPAALPPAAPRRWLIRGAAVVILVFAAVLHWPRVGKPLDGSLASAAATYQVLFFRNWDEAGFTRLRGIPCVGIGGDNAIERDPYLHHPVLTYWIGYALRRHFGWTEMAFRLLPYVATVLAAALTVFLAARLAGLLHGFLAGLLYPLVPLVFGFGLMPNPEATVVLVLLGGMLLHERWRERPTGFRRWLLFAWFFVGCQVDWQVYFLSPALLVAEALRPRGTRRWREPLLLLPIGAAAFLVTCAHFAVGIGDLGALGEHVFETARRTAEGGASHSLPEFMANQGHTWASYLGWPLIAVVAGLLGLGLVRWPAWRRVPGRMLPALAVPVILNIALFRTPSFDHAFYWMPAMIFLPAATAVAVRWLADRVPGAAFALVVALFAWSAWLSMTNDLKAAATVIVHRDTAVLIDRFATSEDLVLTPERLGPAMFYARAKFYEGVRDIDTVERALKRHRWFKRCIVFMARETVPSVQQLVWWLDKRGRAFDHPGVRGWILEP